MLTSPVRYMPRSARFVGASGMTISCQRARTSWDSGRFQLSRTSTISAAAPDAARSLCVSASSLPKCASSDERTESRLRCSPSIALVAIASESMSSTWASSRGSSPIAHTLPDRRSAARRKASVRSSKVRSSMVKRGQLECCQTHFINGMVAVIGPQNYKFGAD